MVSFHYAALVEAGDVLYEAGKTSLYREVAQLIVSQFSSQSDLRRSIVYHDKTISYLLDMAVVFVVVTNMETETRLIFAALEEMKNAFRNPDRVLKFEHTLASILDTYNVDLSELDKPNVQKVLTTMENIPLVGKEMVESDTETDSSKDAVTLDLSDTNTSTIEQSHHWAANSSTKLITAIIIGACLSVIIVLLLIFWAFQDHSSAPPGPITHHEPSIVPFSTPSQQLSG